MTYLAGDVLPAADFNWQTWTPTLSNLTVGSGSLISQYRRTSDTVDFLFKFTYGSGSAVGTDPGFTLPVTPSTAWSVGAQVTGGMHGHLVDLGTANYWAELRFSAGRLGVFARTAITTTSSISSTAPFTWTTGDAILVWGRYYV